MSMPLAAIVLAIYYQRLAVHKLPAREVIVSCFLPVGPLGFGSYTYVCSYFRRPVLLAALELCLHSRV
jgi:hypothetical protein